MSQKATTRTKKQPIGLAYWMERVLAEVEGARKDLNADRIHDLRVALRRCRSIAEGFMVIDPDRRWNALLKKGRQLFKRLGRLRDVQVQMEWVGRLAQVEDPVASALLLRLRQNEEELKRAAVEALDSFDCERWKGWIRKLQTRTRYLPLGGVVCQLNALQAWNEAHALHKLALRNRSDAAYHRLRIGIKRFRYTVENFLPQLQKDLGSDLKEIQDCLGDAHDLLVLWQSALQFRIFPDFESRERWHFLIAAEKSRRIGLYRAKMVGEQSLWSVWRQSLPPQSKLPSITLKMIETWALFQGIHLSRARHVRRLALQLYSGLRPGSSSHSRGERNILHLASILQQSGRAKNASSFDLSFASGLPQESLSTAVTVIRGLREKANFFEGKQQEPATELCGILRLARALSRGSGQSVRSLKVHHGPDSIIISASGYSELSPMAEKVSRARYLLEYVYQKPVLIRGVSATNYHEDPDGNS